MERKLVEIPPDINGLYKSLLDRLDDNVVLLSKQILMWVSQAPRPLKVEELAIACSIERIRSVSHANTFIDGFKENIELCGPMLKIQGEIVHLVHQSAKEFLCNPDLTPSTIFVSLDEANIQMAIACLLYFDVDEFKEVEDLVDDGMLIGGSHLYIASINKYSFLEFSGKFWAQFVIYSNPIHPKCLKFFNEPGRHRVATTFRLNLIFNDLIWDDELSSLASDVLVLATYLGHFSLVRMLFDQRSTPNTDEWDIDYALIVTLEKGYETIARLLLEKGAKVNAQGGFYGNALQAALVEGSETIVRLLLEKGANVNTQGGYYGSALKAAKSLGLETVIRILSDASAQLVGGDFALDNSKASSVTSLIVCDDHAALDISDDTSTTSLPYNDPSRPNINTIATIQGKRLIIF